jgi:phage-related protein
MNANIAEADWMPQIEVVFFQDDDGRVPVLDWLDALGDRARAKCLVRIERLRKLGHELRRPEADYLCNGIYELRVGLRGINHRILYFFHGRTAAVLSHGLVKRRVIPPRQIDLAVHRKTEFERDRARHTYREE